jgi:hypothetical protein
MLRPLDTNMSLFNVDNKAYHSHNDPNSHAVQAVQQDDIVKGTMRQMDTVQKSPETEGEVKIRDGNSEKNKGEKRKKHSHDGKSAEPESGHEEGSSGRLDFLA